MFCMSAVASDNGNLPLLLHRNLIQQSCVNLKFYCVWKSNFNRGHYMRLHVGKFLSVMTNWIENYCNCNHSKECKPTEQMSACTKFVYTSIHLHENCGCMSFSHKSGAYSIWVEGSIVELVAVRCFEGLDTQPSLRILSHGSKGTVSSTRILTGPDWGFPKKAFRLDGGVGSDEKWCVESLKTRRAFRFECTKTFTSLADLPTVIFWAHFFAQSSEQEATHTHNHSKIS